MRLFVGRVNMSSEAAASYIGWTLIAVLAVAVAIVVYRHGVRHIPDRHTATLHAFKLGADLAGRFPGIALAYANGGSAARAELGAVLRMIAAPDRYPQGRDAVRDMTARMLNRGGFPTLAAAELETMSPPDAVELLQALR